MAPGGGAGMFIVGFMQSVNNGGEMWWGGLTGVGHGATMIANAVTLHQIDGLDSYVDGLIEQNGGSGSLYWCADWSANIGVGAAALAGGIYAAGIISAWEAAITLPTIGWNVIMTGGGELLIAPAITFTITGTHALALATGGVLAMSVNALLDAEIIEAQAQMHNAFEGWKMFEELGLRAGQDGNWTFYNEMMQLAEQCLADHQYFKELMRAMLNIRLNIKL